MKLKICPECSSDQMWGPTHDYPFAICCVDCGAEFELIKINDQEIFEDVERELQECKSILDNGIIGANL